MDFVVPLGEELLSSFLGGIRSFLIDKKIGSSRQLLRVLREIRTSFLCLKQASSTRQVLDSKRFYNKDSHSRLSKRETCVNPILEYQEVTYIP